MSDKLIKLIIQLQDDASAGIEKMNGTVSTMVGTFAGGALLGAVQAAGSAIVGLGAGSLAAAADFETATAAFTSVAGGSLAQAGFQIEDVKNKALELGATTAYSAGQAQEAMISLAKGGVPIVDIMSSATAATLDLAAAGDLALAPAADIVAKQLGVWADTGVKAADVANLMAQAANASTVDVEELALGLANVGGVAKVSGVGFQDLTTTMAVLAPGFSSASDAGTSFKTMLLAMQGKSDEAIGVMQELGIVTTDYAAIADDLGITYDGSAASQSRMLEAINATVDAQAGAARGTKAWDEAHAAFIADFQTNAFYDQAGQMKGMDSVAQTLQTSLAGLSEEQKTAALNTMFGSDAYRAAAFLAEAGADGFHAMADSMVAAGTAADQAAIKNKTFAFAWDSLKGSIETVQIILGGVLLPLLTDFTNNALIPAVNGIMDLANAMIASNDPWAVFVASLNSVLPGLGAFVDFVVSNAIPILAGMAAMILAVVVPAFWTWAFAAETGAVATMLALAPLYLTILAIGAVVALLVAAWVNNWFGIQEAVGAVWAYLAPIFAEIGAWLSTNIPIAIAAAVAAFWTIVTAVAAFGASVAAGFWVAVAAVQQFAGQVQAGFWVAVAAVSSFAASVSAGVAVAVAYVMGFVASVQAGFGVVVAFLVGVWAGAVAGVMGFVASVQAGFGVVSAYISGVWAVVSTTTTAAWSTISGAVSTAVGVLVTIITAASNTINFITAWAWGQVWGYIQPVIDSIATAVGPPIAAAAAAIVAAWSALVSFAQTAWAQISGAVTLAASSVVAAWQSTVATLSGVWTSVQTSATSAWSAITSAVSGAVASVSAAVSSGLASASSAAASAWSSIQSGATSAWAAITGAVSSAVASVSAAVSSGLATAASAAAAAWAAIQSAAAAAWAAVVAIFGPGIALLVDILAAGWSAMQANVSAAWANVQGIFSGVWQAIQVIFSVAIEIIKTILTGGWAAIVAASENDFSKVGAILQTVWVTIKSAFQEGVAAVKGIFTGLAADMVGLGQNLVAGVAKGISGAAGQIGSALKSAATSALNAAKSALGIHSPSTVAANTIGAPIIDGIAMGIKAASPKAMAAMLDVASKLIDVVSKGVDAFGKLQQLGSVPQGAIKVFADAIQMALNVFGEAVSSWDKGAMSAASQFTRKAGEVVEVMGKGLDFLLKLQTFRGVPGAAIRAFADALQLAMTELIRISTQEMRIGLMGAVEFAGGAGKILETIGKGVEFLSKLNGFVAPAAGAFIAFRDAVVQAVGYFVQIAGWFANYPVAAATAFADSAGKILAVIGAGVASLQKLVDFTAPAAGAFIAFRDAIVLAVGYFVQIAGWFANYPVAAAVEFADQAGKIVGVIGAGVDSLSKLIDFTAPATESFIAFRDAVVLAVGYFVQIAGWFATYPVAAAVTFAEAAGKILGTIKSGVDGLSALAEFGGVTGGAIDLFTESLTLFVARFIASITDYFVPEMVASAALFAEQAGKIVGIIKSGVEGLNALAGFAGVNDASLVLFIDSLVLFVARLMWTIEGYFAPEALKAAGLFAETAGKIVGIIKNGVDGLNALAGFAGVNDASLVLFIDSLVLFVARLMWTIEGYFAPEALKAASLFADTGGKVVGLIKPGIDGLAALGSLKPVADSSIKLFISLVNVLVIGLAAAASSFSLEAIAAADKFAGAASASVGILEKGVKGLLEVNTFSGVSEAAINRFAEGVRLAVAAMVRLAAEFGAEATAAAKAFAQAAGESTDFLKKGADGLKKVSEFTEVPTAGLAIFAGGVRQMVAMILGLSLIITDQMLADAVRFSLAVDQVISVISGGMKAFSDLAGLSNAATPFLSTFMANVQKLANDFKAAIVPAAEPIGEQIGVSFGSGVAKGQGFATAAIGSMAATVGNGLASIAGQVVQPSENIGLNISYGMANGINAGAPAIQNAVFAAINAAILAAEQALGIASPSKVFDQIGQYSGAGLAGGFAASEGVVAAAAGSMAAASIAPASSSAAGLTSPVARGGGGGGSAPVVAGAFTIEKGAFVITQQPGQSDDALVKKLMKAIEDKYGLRGK